MEALRAQVAVIRRQYEADLRSGYQGVWLPDALARKYPSAPREWPWQWVGVHRTVVDSGAEAAGRAGTRPGVVATSFVAGKFAADDEGSRGEGRVEQAGNAAHAAALLRHAFAGRGDGHPDGAGFVGTQGCGDDSALHPCDAETGARRAQSSG